MSRSWKVWTVTGSARVLTETLNDLERQGWVIKFVMPADFMEGGTLIAWTVVTVRGLSE